MAGWVLEGPIVDGRSAALRVSVGAVWLAAASPLAGFIILTLWSFGF